MATTSTPATSTAKPSSFKHPPRQAVQYLDGCGAIILAWHNRFLEIKGTSKGGTSKKDEQDDALINDEPAINDAYAAFFRSEISASDAAKLRRCQDMQDVAIQPAFIALWRQVQKKLPQYQQNISNETLDNIFAAWLAVAWVLAQVRTNQELIDSEQGSDSVTGKDGSDKDGSSKGWQINNTLAYVAGYKEKGKEKEKGNDRPLITPLRFEKLTSARDPENFTKLLARMVAQIQQQGKPLNVVWLANDILHWFADYQGENYRHPRDKLAVKWALDYYQAGS